MSGYEDEYGSKPEEIHGDQVESGLQKIDLSKIIGQLASPFADIAVPPSFNRRINDSLILPELLALGIQNSLDPMEELSKLQAVAVQEHSGVRPKRRINRAAGHYSSNRGLEIEVTERDEFLDRQIASSSSDSLLRFRSGNRWGFGRQYEPYEHRGVSSTALTMETDPTVGSTSAGMTMQVHPETPKDRNSGDSIVDALISIKEFDNHVFQYDFTTQVYDELYTMRQGEGKGRVVTLEDGTKIITEHIGGNLSIRHFAEVEDSFKLGSKIDATDEEKDKAQAKFKDRLKELVSDQLDVVSDEFMGYAKHIASFWDAELPEASISPIEQLGKGDSDHLGGLLKNSEGADGNTEIPPSVKDDRQRTLYSQIAKKAPSITFDMIGGLDKEVGRMQQVVAKAMNPERYEEVGLDPRATALLVGPPGTGKTMLAEAVANHVDGIFLSVKGSDLMSMWAGEAEKNVAAMFDLVEVLGKEQKAVLFLDEIEAVAPSRTGQYMMEHERKITAEFLSGLNRKYPNVIIIAATNTPANVDPAVTRAGRFSDTIAIENPGHDGRVHILNNWMDYFGNKASIEVFDRVDVEALATTTEGLSGADIRTIIEAALVNEVETALSEDRAFQTLGTTALLVHVEDHMAANSQRFNNYLASPQQSLAQQERPSQKILPIPKGSVQTT